MQFIDKYGKEEDGKKSQQYLDLDKIPEGEEDRFIDEAQELRQKLDIERINIMNSMERFLLAFRDEYII